MPPGRRVARGRRQTTKGSPSKRSTTVKPSTGARRSVLTRFEVASLFWPPFAPARRDSRFDRLTERIGLARYWDETGVTPDYRAADA